MLEQLSHLLDKIQFSRNGLLNVHMQQSIHSRRNPAGEEESVSIGGESSQSKYSKGHDHVSAEYHERTYDYLQNKQHHLGQPFQKWKLDHLKL